MKKSFDTTSNTLSTEDGPKVKVESDIFLQLVPPDTLSAPTVAALQAASQMEAPIESEE